jgi:ribosome-associated protein
MHWPRRGLLELLETARAMTEIIAGKMGSDILLLDLNKLTIIADFFIIATGDSERQLGAMAQELVEKMNEQQGLQPLAVEGTPESGWILIDYGAIVVHLFSEAQRERYQLEKLWSGARTVVRMA